MEPKDIIINESLNYLGFEMWELNDRTHRNEIVAARYKVMYFLRRYTKMSNAKVAGVFGLNHATCNYAMDMVRDKIQIYQDYRKEMEELETIIKNKLNLMKDRLKDHIKKIDFLEETIRIKAFGMTEKALLNHVQAMKDNNIDPAKFDTFFQDFVNTVCNKNEDRMFLFDQYNAL